MHKCPNTNWKFSVLDRRLNVFSFDETSEGKESFTDIQQPIFAYKCLSLMAILRFSSSEILFIVNYVLCKIAHRKGVVSIDLFWSYHKQNYSDYKSASIAPICNPEFVIRVSIWIDFGYYLLRIDQDLTFTYLSIKCVFIFLYNSGLSSTFPWSTSGSFCHFFSC